MPKKDAVPTVIICKKPKPIAEKTPSHHQKRVKRLPLTSMQRVAAIRQVRQSVYGDILPQSLQLDPDPPAVVELTPDAPRSGNHWYNVMGFDGPADNYAGGRSIESDIWPNSYGLSFHFETIPGNTYLVDLSVSGYVEKWIFSGAVEATVTPSDPNFEHILIAFTANSTHSGLRARVQFFQSSDWASPASFFGCVLTCVD